MRSEDGAFTLKLAHGILNPDLSEERLLELGQILFAVGYYFLRVPNRLLAS